MKGTLTGRCDSCKEHHPLDSMCPPHEVRTTGFAWFQVYVDELEAEFKRLQVIIKKLARMTHNWKVPDLPQVYQKPLKQLIEVAKVKDE